MLSKAVAVTIKIKCFQKVTKIGDSRDLKNKMFLKCGSTTDQIAWFSNRHIKKV